MRDTDLASEGQTVASAWAHAIIVVAESMGLERQSLLSSLPKHALESGLIPLTDVLRLWRSAEQSYAGSDFGLQLGQRMKPSFFPLFALSLMESRHMGEALNKAERYIRVLSEGGGFQVEVNDGVASVVYQPAAKGFSHHQIDTVIGLTRNCLNWLACRTLPLISVELQHPNPGNGQAYEDWFHCTVEFGAARNSIQFDAFWLQESVGLTFDPVLQQQEQRLEDELNALEGDALVKQVRSYLQHREHLLLHRDQVAARFNMSGRSLQRKLTLSDTSYQSLLEQERRRRAHLLLQDGQVELQAISDELGFAELSGFSRACRRWFEQSPQQYRQARVKQQD